MVRQYKKKLGPSAYQKYTEHNLQRAVSAVKSDRLTLCRACEKYGVPKATLSRKVRNLNPLTIGGQTALTAEEENRKKTITTYFENLRESIRGLPASNIINYDETNFSDDPGASKVIVRRGAKHPERVMDSSKTSTSVMMSGSADGYLLPPYVVYKAAHLYPTWVEGGVPGSAYNRNKSGWFDLEMFEDWFRVICLPHCRSLEGEKALLGDNLSSHLNYNVIELCEKNNIRFILLPPNSTHLCQPLDVSVFGPLKRTWRSTLLNWKKKNRGVLPKSEFPRTFKTAIELAGGFKSQNLISGFTACGIFPFNPEKALAKLPQETPVSDEEDINRAITDSFVRHLAELRSADVPTTRARGKRLDIEPGKSVTSLWVNRNDTDSSEDAENVLAEVSSESEGEDGEDPENEESTSFSPPGVDVVYKPGDFVLVALTAENGAEKYFLGNILKEESPNTFKVKFLRSRKGRKDTFFVYPDVPDVSEVSKSEIIMQIFPKEIRRGRYVCESLRDTQMA